MSCRTRAAARNLVFCEGSSVAFGMNFFILSGPPGMAPPGDKCTPGRGVFELPPSGRVKPWGKVMGSRISLCRGVSVVRALPMETGQAFGLFFRR